MWSEVFVCCIQFFDRWPNVYRVGPSVCVCIPDAPSRGNASEKLSAHVHTGGDTFELGILYIEAADDRFIGNFGATRVTM